MNELTATGIITSGTLAGSGTVINQASCPSDDSVLASADLTNGTNIAALLANPDFAQLFLDELQAKDAAYLNGALHPTIAGSLLYGSKAWKGPTFTTCHDNNTFGNTNRFTDTLGGQTYANGLIIDHWWNDLYYNVEIDSGFWQDVMDAAAAIDVDGFTGFSLPDLDTFYGVFDATTGIAWKYAPFNLSNNRFWLSTQGAGNNALYAYVPYNIAGVTLGFMNVATKATTSNKGLAVRKWIT